MDNFVEVIMLLAQLHPLVVHFPIAATILAGVLWVVYPDNVKAATVLLWVALVTAMGAGVTGWLQADKYHVQMADIPAHKWWAVATMIALALSLICHHKLLRLQNEKAVKAWALGFLIVACVSVSVTGYYGGKMAWGESFLTVSQQDQVNQNLAWVVAHQILHRRCVRCHNTENSMGQLDLSTQAGILKGGEFGPVISGNNPDSSQLIIAIEKAPKEKGHMPLNRGSLAKSEIQALRHWIAQGGYEQLQGKASEQRLEPVGWAYEQIKRPQIPRPQDLDWSNNPIDRFILAGLENENLAAPERAPLWQRLRRASLLLRGRPLSPAEVRAIPKDNNLIYYLVQVKKYLGEKDFGENWAPLWFDLFRFAETTGYEEDQDYPGAIRYKKFIIDSMNSDRAFDEVIRWQLAGDQLAPEQKLAHVATAYLTMQPVNSTAVNSEESQQRRLDEMVNNTMSAHLGMEFACAQCHNHKFEPIQMQEYFGLRFGFHSANLDPSQIDVFHKSKNSRARSWPQNFAPIEEAPTGPIFRSGNIDDIMGQTGFSLLKAYEGDNTDILFWQNKIASHSPRSILAHWLTDSKDGVGYFVARVLVNSIWQRYFGRGLVPTEMGFGAHTPKPPQLALLNFLATELVRNNWSLKSIHHLIATSETFQMARTRELEHSEFYWGWQPHALPGETLRDAMIFVSGQIQRVAPEDSLEPPLYMRRTQTAHRNSWKSVHLREHKFGKSVYVKQRRNMIYPPLEALGQPPRDEVNLGRVNQLNYQQGLFLMNSIHVGEFSHYIVSKTMRENKDQPEAQVQKMFLTTFNRPPTEAELNSVLQYLNSHSSERQGLMDVSRVLFASNEFTHVE